MNYLRYLILLTLWSLRRALHRVLGWRPFWLHGAFYWHILVYPFDLFLAAWRLGRWRNLFFGLPAVFVLILLGWLNHWEWQSNLTLTDRYLKHAESSFVKGDFVQAEMLLNRILRETRDKNTEAIEISLAEIYEKTGQTERAEFLYLTLAPDDRYGNPMAHRRLARVLCEKLTPASSRQHLDRALHHLQASRAENDISPDMLLAWARYSIVVGDRDKARDYLERVVTVFPEVSRNLGTIYLQLGLQEKALSSFSTAKTYLGEQLSRNPKSRSTREDYVSVLIQIGEMDEARNVLETGMEVDPDGNWRVILSEFYVIVHDVMVREGGHSVGELFDPLAKSLEQEPNSPLALNRLMAYVSADVKGNVALRTILSRVVAEAKEPALAHLALGNICCVEHDLDAALFHFERCVAINKKLSIVLNNLAWILAHNEDHPDLERALAMANAALEENPGFARFLDTRGTILMKMERWKDALADLELAVNGEPNQAEVHDKLSEIYDHLKLPEIALQHRELATEIRNKLSVMK